MKIALSTFNIRENEISHNVDQIIQNLVRIKKETEVDFVMFPEDCFTGLNVTDNPNNDIHLGRNLNSEELNRIKKIAKEYNVFVNFGLLENSENKLYDSSVIIDNNGKIILIHRRIHKCWFNSNLKSKLFGAGEFLEKVETKLGSFIILICGEITDEQLLVKAHELKADFLLFPLLRSSNDYSKQWLKDEMEYYTKQISKTNTLSFMVNGINLQREYFGGAWVISESGEIIKELDTLSEGYVVYDTRDLKKNCH